MKLSLSSFFTRQSNDIKIMQDDAHEQFQQRFSKFYNQENHSITYIADVRQEKKLRKLNDWNNVKQMLTNLSRKILSPSMKECKI